MADKNNIDETSGVVTHNFSGGMNKDIDSIFLKENLWTHARNAINNSKAGNLGVIGNEPSNLFCTNVPYTFIGAIHLYTDKWVLYSTDDTNSEIGLFDESECSYTKIVNDPCLGFNRANLIVGVAKQNFDCSWQTYWADGVRPDRTLNIDRVPFIQNCVVVNNCQICTDTTQLDCDKIRLAELMVIPCLRVQKGASGGTLPNGSYYAVIAYTINGIKVTDYFTPSNVQSIFEHDNVAGSLDIFIDNIDTDYFSEFELVIVATINQQTVARKLGIYSTQQRLITVDAIDNTLPAIPISLIPIQTPVFDKSDGIFENGDYMLRTGPSTKFDFNYQPLANTIVTHWVSVEYPSDYYVKGGNVTGYLRDEIYPLFIRWAYDTGDKSPSFHLPGRASVPSDVAIVAGPDAAIEISEGITPFAWRVQNTASVTSLATSTLPDGGIQIAEGLMGYWESTELYPDNLPAIWGNLCGQPIRHHRFPDNALHPTTNHINAGASKIRIMGIKLDNIQVPVDNNNVPIPGIVGYEILRGSREGNKTVIAKGIINNMGEYAIDPTITNRQGVYPNYPYNDLNPDQFISTTPTSTNILGTVQNLNPQSSFRRDMFTLHAPETQFSNPFLSATELKVYGSISSTVNGRFIDPQFHPKHKLVTNVTFFVAMAAGIGLAMSALSGKRKVLRLGPQRINLGGVWAGTSSGAQPIDLGAGGAVTENLWNTTYQATTSAFYSLAGLQIPITALLGTGNNAAFTGYYSIMENATIPTQLLPGTIGYSTNIEQEDGLYDQLPLPLRVLNSIPTFSYFMSQGAEEVMRIIKAVVPFRQYALEYISHGFYNNFIGPSPNNNRRLISDSIYLDSQIQDFNTGFRINNLYRGRSVAIQTTATLASSAADNTRQRVGDNPGTVTHADPYPSFATTSEVHYAALKQRIRNQYGQIEGIRQVPVSGCLTDKTFVKSPVYFGGDTYVTRYTEKNMMPFFYDWMYKQPDGYEFDYFIAKNIPYPSYWMDTKEFDVNDFFQSVLTNPLTPGAWITPSDRHALDKSSPITSGFFEVKKAFMYLFSCGIRDFFVESEINTDLRDWGELPEQRHYDPYRYTDLNELFATPIIKAGNYFKYDISLSISKLFNNLISWGITHERNYDPTVALTCYSYYKNRVIYSLPQNLELQKDNWRVFLVNNYVDFKSKITTIKPIAKSGAIIFFESDSPLQFQGLDTLETDLNTKLTIGDGGLFSQPLQNVSNADISYEYGSCQNKLSVVNTPTGIYFMCQNQGKIFLMTDHLEEISMDGLKWWFAEYLPYSLTQTFPDFELIDNPVIGIGCMAIYDNEDGLIYFTKKDYKIKTGLTQSVVYLSSNQFLVDGMLTIDLGDPAYFEDASWTVSYDPKSKAWISFHDWHPNYLLPSKTHFMSVLNDGIWKHNTRCDNYCNYYGIDYPWEIEYPAVTGQQVNITRSLEYILECYRYASNCLDAFHVLDFNFNEAVIYNTEQVSGLLKLVLTPKGNPVAAMTYPIINPTNINILFSKVENKYRFNQFWDITDDRGEFNPTAQRVIWNTGANGYVKTLNANNLNYQKAMLQRKDFRHYINLVFLRRTISGDTKMMLKIINNKNQISLR